MYTAAICCKDVVNDPSILFACLCYVGEANCNSVQVGTNKHEAKTERNNYDRSLLNAHASPMDITFWRMCEKKKQEKKGNLMKEKWIKTKRRTWKLNKEINLRKHENMRTSCTLITKEGQL